MSITIIAFIVGLLLGATLMAFWPKKKPVQSRLEIRAAELVNQHHDLDASGEFKRHSVYAILIKEFPKRTKREISKAIEAAL